MNRAFLNIIASALLLFNGFGAIYGGWNLMWDPEGESMHLSLLLLQHTPFNDFQIPGFVLFSLMGLFSIWVFMSLLFHDGVFAVLVITEGVLLTGWIGVQMLMIREINLLHVVMGATGLLLILTGHLINKNRRERI